MRPMSLAVPTLLFATLLAGPVARATELRMTAFDSPPPVNGPAVSLVDDLKLGMGMEGDLGGGDSVHVHVGGNIFAAIASFFIPGLGQLFNGQLLKGIVVFFVFVALSGGFGFTYWQPAYGPAVGGLLALAAFVWWIGNIVDAFTGNFYAFLPGDRDRGCGGDAVPLTRDERYDLVVPATRPILASQGF